MNQTNRLEKMKKVGVIMEKIQQKLEEVSQTRSITQIEMNEINKHFAFILCEIRDINSSIADLAGECRILKSENKYNHKRIVILTAEADQAKKARDNKQARIELLEKQVQNLNKQLVKLVK